MVDSQAPVSRNASGSHVDGRSIMSCQIAAALIVLLFMV